MPFSIPAIAYLLLLAGNRFGLLYCRTTKPPESRVTQPLTMCILMERNTSGLMYDYNRMEAALDMALQYVNEIVVSPYYHIDMVYIDLGPYCPPASLSKAPAYALDLFDKGIKCTVYLGPGCGFASEAISNLAEPLDIPIIGLPAASVGITADVSLYAVLTRISITFPTLQAALLKFLKHFRYSSVAFFTDDDFTVSGQMGELVESTMRSSQSSTRLTATFDQFHSREYNAPVVRSLLERASEFATVIVVFTDSSGLRTFMRTAHGMLLTSGRHIFVAVELYKSQIWGNFSWNYGQSDDHIIRDAYRAVFLLSLFLEATGDNGDDLVLFWKEVQKRSRTVFGYNGFDEFDRVNIDPLVVHAYEAVLMYGITAAKMHKNGANIASGLQFTNYTANLTFDSPITGVVSIDANSDREIPYIMRAFIEETQQHETLFGFPIGKKGLTQLGHISFINRPTLPANIIPCLDRSHCISRANSTEVVVAIVAVCLGLLAVVSIAAAFYVKKKHKNDLDPYWWRIFIKDLQPYVYSSSGDLKRKSTQNASSYSERRASDVKKEPERPEKGQHNPDTKIRTSAMHQGQPVSLVECASPQKRVPFQMYKEAMVMRHLMHPNMQKFHGVVINENNACEYVAMEYCQRGSLGQLISDHSMDLDWQFKQSLISDLVQGILYLHTTEILSHGFLCDDACQIDSRFVLKLSDYGFPSLRHEFDLQPVTFETEFEDPRRNYRILLWRAPELLRRRMPENGTQKGDVYSFGILLQQIILQSQPFQLGKHAKAHNTREEHSTKDIVLEVKRGLQPPLRPSLPVSACTPELHHLIDECWDENPAVRMPFAKIRQTTVKIFGKSQKNLIAHLISRMEQYAASLEHQVHQKTQQFMEERQRSSDLLQHILPPAVAQALSRGTPIHPETFNDCTVYFGDVTGYAEAVEKCDTPMETVSLLNDLYTVCDTAVAEFDVYKVETVNDAYLVVSGLPVRNGQRHVEQIASMAIMLRRRIGDMRLMSERTKEFKLRAGIHSGPCVAGIIGSKLPRYCLFGDTVNTASRMESHGEGGKLHCSEATRNLLRAFPEFTLIDRGTIAVKGKGPMQTYWLIGKD